MNSSILSYHVMDDFPDSLGYVSKLVEFLILQILAGFVVGMYRGIEIGHPGLKPRYLRNVSCLKLQFNEPVAVLKLMLML